MAEKQVKLSYDEIVDLLREYQLSPTVQKLNEYYNELSFLDILRVDRKENYHSNFLKWIFEDPELCEFSIKRLLLLLLKRRGQYKSSYFPDKVIDLLLTTSFFIEHVEAKLEDAAVAKGKKGRSDILITIKYRDSEKPLYVIVENKVYSSEHDKQTETYYVHYTRNYKKENCIFVFLTPLPSIELNKLCDPECDCKYFIQINYQDILDEILSPLLNDESIQQRKHFIIKEYIKALSINYSQQNKIMAMDAQLRELLVDFWENNEQLITLSLSALKDDDTQDFDTLKAAKELSGVIEKIRKAKDKTHYKFNGNPCNGKGALVEAIIKYCITEKKMNTKDINEKWMNFLENVNFDKDKKWTFQNHPEETVNRKTESNKLKNQGIVYDNTSEIKKVKSSDHNFKETTINGHTYWYYTQWGWKNIDFIIGFYRNEIKKGKDPDIELIFNKE